MAVVKPQTPGLIDTISAGYVTLKWRLWVVMVPIVLDLYLWLGTRLSLAPLIRRLSDQAASVLAQLSPDIAQPAPLVQNFQQADLRVLLAWINFVPLLPEFLLPPPGEQAVLPGFGVVLVTNWWVLVGVALLINLITLLMVVAITGSAYIQSGLIAARLVFYCDRRRCWKGTELPVSIA